MKTPQAIMFAVAAFWLGQLQGADANGANVRDTVIFAAAVVAAAVTWELVVRRAKERT